MYRTDHDNVYESGKLIEEGSGYVCLVAGH